MDRTCQILYEDMVGKGQAGLLLAGSFFSQIFHFHPANEKKMETLYCRKYHRSSDTC
jgi:hypothetical protein